MAGMAALGGQVLPGILQAGAGMAQGGLDFIAELINQGRLDEVGNQLQNLGQTATTQFQENIFPQLDAAQQDLEAGITSGQSTLDQTAGSLNTSEQNALQGFEGIIPQAQDAVADVLNRIEGFQDLAADVRNEIRANVQAALDRNSTALDEVRTLGQQAVDEFTTETVDVAGGQVSGMRMASERRIQDFIAEARANGMSQQDIDREVSTMRSQVDANISNVWSNATTTINQTRLNTRQNTQNQLSSMHQTFAATAQQGINSLLAAGGLEVSAGETGAQLAQGAYNYLTGTMMGVAESTANVIGNFASMRTNLGIATSTFQMNAGLNLAQNHQANATAFAQSLDRGLSLIREGMLTKVSRPFEFPNFAGLMQPGLQMVQQGVANWTAVSSQPQPQNNTGAILGGAGISTAGALGAAGIISGGLAAPAILPSAAAFLSDVTMKERVLPLSHRRVLDAVKKLDVTSWRYKEGAGPSGRHYGPMAQDFYATFGLGDSDKHINYIDSIGVLFSALKGEVEYREALEARIAALEASLRETRRTEVAA